jgi:beta-lactamase class A
MTLKHKIQSVIEQSGAKIAVALHHIESGEEVMINADDYHPLASTLKIPVLVEACYRMAAGEFAPNDRWELKNAEKNFPSGVLVFFDEGLQPTVKDILMMMIIISDNTATDIAINRLGKEAINQRMRDLGLDHTHIPMTIRELFEEIMPDANPNKPIEEIYRMQASEEKKSLDPGNRVVSLTPENIVGTPRDMTSLLKMIYEGKTPDRQWSDFAINILLHQQLNARIPRFLPPGTMVAHKTGTIGPVKNDAGIIYVNENSHIILSEYVMWDVPTDPAENLVRSAQIEDLMGQIALTAYEAYS